MNIEQAIQSVLREFTEDYSFSADPHNWSNLQKRVFKAAVKSEMNTCMTIEMELDCIERAAPQYQPEMIEKQEIDYVFTAQTVETICEAMQRSRRLGNEHDEHRADDNFERAASMR